MTTSSTASRLPTEITGGRSPGFWGMLLFIATEATLFGSLLSAYFYIASGSASWPPDGIAKPEIPLALINTIILICSSIPIFWADRGIRKGNGRQLRIGFALTFILGVIFLGIQAYEYTELEFTITTNAYGSLFYTITGFHFLHVTLGVLMNLYIQLRAWLGHFSAKHRLAVQNVAIYWHFVDVAWIFIFLSLYVSPHLL